ncbi:hypothetical protein E4P41_07160 [Geodermatophilus sp. DF01-2]|nr:hypothetical protein E4P41_07160 [Geodermatophilus sp. DF01_2]
MHGGHRPGAGTVDRGTEWSHAAPSAAEENEEIDTHGHDGYGAWHLAVDPDASEHTKERYEFPYGEWPAAGPRSRPRPGHRPERARGGEDGALLRCGAVLLHGEIVDAADDLLRRLDARTG